MKPSKAEQLAEHYNLIIGALCIWRESRGEPLDGKIAVWNVLKNRLESGQWGKTMMAVVTARWQFSAFNSGDPNATKFPNPDDPTWKQCLDVVTGNGPDLTLGAQFYFNPKIVKPNWAEKMEKTGSFGNHDFYRNKEA